MARIGGLMSRTSVALAALALSAGLAMPAAAQLRVATWNVSLYGGPNATRDPAFATVLFSSFQGRSMNPDIIIFQEINAVGGLNSLLSIMNNATAPGTFAAAPYVAGPDSNSIMIYRTSKVQFLGQSIASTGGAAPLPPRNTMRYDVRPVGYASAGATMAIYSVHMKAGTATSDEQRRQLEAQNIRANAQALPAGWSFIVGGDYNVQNSTDLGYVALVQSLANNLGRCFDPIRSPGTGAAGTWNAQSSQRFLHTQAPGGDPGTTGGMDDRFDFLLVSANLIDGIAGQGLEYIGNPNVAFSTTTWNDPNHSYRVWGNDGSFFNQSITSTAATNAMVGPTIANAIATTAITDTFGGHAPVFMDLRVPPRVGSPASVDFGTVAQGSSATSPLTVSNAGNTTLWTAAGIGTLSYTVAATGDFTISAPGPFQAPGGGSGPALTITMNTATPGPKTGSIVITSNSPEEPTRTITLSGQVQGAVACYANCDGSTIVPVLNALDFSCFLNRYIAGDPYANCDGSTIVPTLNALDFACFLNAYVAGCR